MMNDVSALTPSHRLFSLGFLNLCKIYLKLNYIDVIDISLLVATKLHLFAVSVVSLIPFGECL